MKLCIRTILLAWLHLATIQSFQSHVLPMLALSRRQRISPICMATIDAPESSGDADDAENEEVVEPGKMRVSEIKSELELRGVDYSDCFDKESLATKLEEARSTGKATPDLIDKFNKAKLEETFREEKLAINDEDLQSMTANDGTLPGGMSPEAFKNAINNPELMAMAQNPKMQDAMKVVMTGGPEELENAMRKDPELREFLGKLTQVMGGIESSLESKGDISVLESKEDVSPPESVFE